LKEEWNKRYEQADYFYGTDPNQWLVEVLKQMQPGKVLFPAEGEGRNAVYAATQGWQVWAFDQSEMGKKKAEELAQAKGVSIHYALADARQVDYPDAFFDALVFIYAHFTQPGRKEIMQHLMKSLKPGGLIVFEGVFEATDTISGNIQFRRSPQCRNVVQCSRSAGKLWRYTV